VTVPNPFGFPPMPERLAAEYNRLAFELCGFVPPVVVDPDPTPAHGIVRPRLEVVRGEA